MSPIRGTKAFPVLLPTYQSFIRPMPMLPIRKTFQSIFQAGLLPILALCALLAVLLVLLLTGLITWLTAILVNFEKSWLDILLNSTVGVLAGIGGWFVLPAFMVLVAGIFQETTIHRVERIYYPDKVRKSEPNLWPDLMHDIRFTLRALLLNILILPFYLLGIGFLLSIGLNSYLLGREFFESAAGYHIGKPKASGLRKKHKKIIYGGGFAITLMTLTPILNLFAPILAIVWMVHVYHSGKISSDATELSDGYNDKELR